MYVEPAAVSGALEEPEGKGDSCLMGSMKTTKVGNRLSLKSFQSLALHP